MKITIIGCGSIGTTLARFLETMDEIELVHVFDTKKEAVERLMQECTKVRYAENLENAFESSDLVVETASQAAVFEYIPKALEMGKNVLVMSVGAFVEDDFKEKCRILAKQKGCKVYIPSGAVCGIEGICAAAISEVEEVIIMSYKPIEAFRGVKFLKQSGIDLDTIKRPRVIFNGHARDAVKHFPKNVNVAATLSLAGIGIDNTVVRIVVDPKATLNTHRIIAKGKFGEIECWTRNMPFPDNPRTSYLAALSLISAVKKISGSFWVGV